MQRGVIRTSFFQFDVEADSGFEKMQRRRAAPSKISPSSRAALPLSLLHLARFFAFSSLISRTMSTEGKVSPCCTALQPCRREKLTPTSSQSSSDHHLPSWFVSSCSLCHRNTSLTSIYLQPLPGKLASPLASRKSPWILPARTRSASRSFTRLSATL